MIIIKSEEEIAKIRIANQIVAGALDLITTEIRPGIRTIDLDRLVETYIVENNAKPAFKGYRGYKHALCISVNNEVVHGIPGNRRLLHGDIVSCDIGAVFEDYYGDAASTFPVGEVSFTAKRLIEVTKQALYCGIEVALPGNRLYDISHSIQTHVESNGFSIVQMFVGHGVGRSLHEDPQIPNYGTAGHGVRLRPGMVLALEPMVNEGTHGVRILNDGWTAVTEDGKLSAHFEHSIVVRDGKPEILSEIKRDAIL